MKRLLLLVATMSCVAAASPVSQSELVSLSVELPSRGGVKQVALFCYSGEPGKVREKRGKLLFTALSEIVKRRRQRFRQEKSSKTRKQLQNSRKLARAATGRCDNIGSLTPSPTPTPNGGGESNSTPQNSYFDRDGNVTPLGFEIFQIPISLSANAFVGETLFTQYCTGCHGKRTQLTFPQLRQRISQSPMFFSAEEIPDQNLADLFAYLAVGRSPLRE